MLPKDIPDFIFRGNILAVDGSEETVKDYSLVDRRVGGRFASMEQDLYLEFKSGLTMIYDASRVKKIPGKAPEFIFEGAMVFCRDPLPKDASGARFTNAANGTWEITHFHFEKEGKEERLRLLMKRPWVPGPGILSRHFNARTMTPVPDGPEIPRSPETPAFELENDLRVRKPLVLKRPQ